jgi:thymidylate synthase
MIHYFDRLIILSRDPYQTIYSSIQSEEMLNKLSDEERQLRCPVFTEDSYGVEGELRSPLTMDWERTPKRAISLMWNQRSVDTFLGLPFNIASYGLLLEIIAKMVNMVPDELIGNLGDVHLYSNHIEQAKEQIGIDLTHQERIDWWFHNSKPNRDVVEDFDSLPPEIQMVRLNKSEIPSKSRTPFPLPTLNIVGYPDEYNHPNDERLFGEFDVSDFLIENYQSHPTIKAPLSN